MRVALCTNILSPYRLPVFRAMVEELGWDLRIFVDAEREADRHWTIDEHATRGLSVERARTITRRHRFRVREPVVFDQVIERHWPVDLVARLRRWKPELVISGEIGPRSWSARAAAATMGVPFVLWAYQSRAGASAWMRRPGLRRALVRRSDAIVGMGVQAREALEAIGAESPRIFDAPNAADIDRIVDRRTCVEHRIRLDQIHRRSDRRRRAVVVGRLVPMKGIERLLDAWAMVPESRRSAWRLTFVGDGPLRPLVEAHPNAELVGSVPAVEVTDWLAASDLHVFPTLGDPWGLVVNEAMHCGTPTACSVHAGCFDDLHQCREGMFAIDPTRPAAAFAEELGAILDRDDLDLMGRHAERTGRDFTPSRMAAAFADAAACASRRRPPARSRIGGLVWTR